MIHIHGLLSQPNKWSLYYAIRVLKIATDRDLLHTISIVFTEYSGLYIDLCCLQQYTLQSTVHSWTIIMHLNPIRSGGGFKSPPSDFLLSHI